MRVCGRTDGSQGDVGAVTAATLWSLSERLVAASNASGRSDSVVLAGKAGAWRPVADGEQFGPGHSFSMNLTTGERFVSVPVRCNCTQNHHLLSLIMRFCFR